MAARVRDLDAYGGLLAAAEAALDGDLNSLRQGEGPGRPAPGVASLVEACDAPVQSPAVGKSQAAHVGRKAGVVGADAAEGRGEARRLRDLHLVRLGRFDRVPGEEHSRR